MGAMRIDEIYASGDRPVFSFEFFPPRTPEGEANLYLALAGLRPLAPDFVSVTYGAGGSTRGKTLEIVSRIRDEIGLEAMAHFTCVGATVDELRSTLDEMSRLGFDNVLALRGDPPQGQEEWTKTEGGLEYSRELVELISGELPGFSIGAACFPETHIHATSAEDDLRYLKEKVDAGVELPHHPALLRQRALLRLRRPRPRDRHRGPDRARHPAHHDLQPALARDEHVRRDDPRPRAHRPAPAQGERRGGGRVRRRLRDDAVRRPAGQRRARASTSTRSTAPRRRARSSARCASGAPGTATAPPWARRSASRPPSSAARCRASRPAPASRRGAGSARRRCRPGGRCPRPRRPGTSASR